MRVLKVSNSWPSAFRAKHLLHLALLCSCFFIFLLFINSSVFSKPHSSDRSLALSHRIPIDQVEHEKVLATEEHQWPYVRRRDATRTLSATRKVQDEDEEEPPSNKPYSLGMKISNWDEQRAAWLARNPKFPNYVKGKPRIMLVTGSQPTPCENPVGDHYLVKSIKNKIDYCRLHNIEIFYNMAHLDSVMSGFWAKLPLLRKMMLSHPEVEWIWWMDSDAMFTDMVFEVPIERYKDYNAVFHGWDELVYNKKSWIGLNTGSFLIRNCQWTLDLLDTLAPMGPKGKIRDEAGKVLTRTLEGRPEFEADDQSAMIYLLVTQRAKWGDKVYLESSYYLHGYWVILVDKYEEMIEKYHPGLGDDRWPFVTHFVGCKPCGKGTDYAAQRCIKQMERAFNFADDQVLQMYGFQHKRLGSWRVKRMRNETDRPLEFQDDLGLITRRVLHGSVIHISKLVMAASSSFHKLLLLLLVLSLAATHVCSWRREEFRNCNQTPFCKKARAFKAGESNYEVSEVAIVDGHVQANLFPLSPAEGEPSSPLSLELIFYNDHIIRVRINELHDPSDESKRQRFEVPDVLESTLDDKKLWLKTIIEKDGASVVSLASNLHVFLQHKPFEIHLQDGEERLLSFNSKGLFQFEQLREKKEEGSEWEESFRSHTDSRPHGPQSISFDVSFYGADHVYGVPEHATSLALKPTRGPDITSEPYRLFNLDVFEYIEESPFGLYGSIPFMLSHSASRSTGFFWLNSAEMLVDVLAPGWEKGDLKEENDVSNQIDTQWISESGIVDAFLFVGPKPKDLLRQYTTVTGLPIMPQFFATAYHQSRWNYKDEADVYNVDATFDEHDIPYDVLWLDIEHTDGKRYFTYDKNVFPHPKEMQEKLMSKGRHMVNIVDPHIKRDDGYFLHKEATSKGYYVKDVHGRDYDGWCWPGSSSYLDMLNPEIRKWWSSKFSYANYEGSTSSLYIWNDMNEPSVFNGPEATMPRDCVHYGGVEHRDVHNAYGYYFHMATANGLVERGGGNDRPFVLSRAFFAGTQKVGAVWTGDNTAEWDHLQVSVPMVLTLGITGLSFTGADVGGFFGNPDPELLTRWYQLAAFYPFFRAHAHLDTKRREPWLFGEPYTSYIREAIRVRYALLPFFYTLFWEASTTGVPIMRPLWMEFPEEEMTFAMDKECMVGSSLLLHGVYTEGATSESVYLPGEEPWYDVKTGATFSGGDYHKIPVTMESIPVFQRGGSIIPRKDRPRRSSTQMVNDPYTLVIALNSDYEAEGELYVDDGKSFDFAEGAYIHRKFIFSQGRLTSTSIKARKKGNKEFTSSCVVERIIILGLRVKDLPGIKHAVVEPHNRRVELEAGPLLLQSGAQVNAHIIRKPNVLVAEDWSIKVL